MFPVALTVLNRDYNKGGYYNPLLSTVSRRGSIPKPYFLNILNPTWSSIGLPFFVGGWGAVGYTLHYGGGGGGGA